MISGNVSREVGRLAIINVKSASVIFVIDNCPALLTLCYPKLEICKEREKSLNNEAPNLVQHTIHSQHTHTMQGVGGKPTVKAALLVSQDALHPKSLLELPLLLTPPNSVLNTVHAH